MSSLRLTLLCAFAGGCLSNALLFGIWRVAEGSGASAAKQAQQSHNVVELVAPPPATPSVVGPVVLVATTPADHGREAAIEAAPVPVTTDLDNAGPAPAGSAVSDVLTRLEAAYREHGAASLPQASLPQQQATTANPADNTLPAPEAAPSVPAEPVAAVVPATLAIAAAPQATLPAAFAAQPAASPAALPPQAAAAPAVAAPDAPPPTVVQYGDVNQNTYITNVREGDVYQIQMQQLAVLQYMQLMGMSGGTAAPARRAGGAGRQQRGTLSSGITNPDNPWGFRFAPLNLVR